MLENAIVALWLQQQTAKLYNEKKKKKHFLKSSLYYIEFLQNSPSWGLTLTLNSYNPNCFLCSEGHLASDYFKPHRDFKAHL